MTDNTDALPHCGLLRRLAAIFYDALLLLAVLFIATALAMLFTDGEAIRANHPLFTTYIFFVTFLFFAWFWTHGGQTLGMRAWRIRAQTRDGTAMSWSQALLRFMVAIASWGLLGLGFLWSLIDREKMTWHDRYSETVLVVLTKRQEKG